ncbi:DUF3040 domain-containing protein [uncultured Jatrophihabitans sp.]|uniref:DUF3040 domain-containing protein n=1 Tax=uncultured Jatrophihabitans sp. TaxID=1610747 RepID=UPI0035C99D4E
MPLSDHEQRLLDEIEQALYADDPKFAASVRAARTKSRTRRTIVLSVVGVVAGLALVLVGLVANIIALSVVGFVLVVGSCGWVAQMLRGRKDVTPADATAPAGGERHSSGLRTRMEDRLRKRFDEN